MRSTVRSLFEHLFNPLFDCSIRTGDVYAFSSDYGMDLASWHSAWQALLIVALVVAGLAWLARLTAISRKKQGNPLSGDDLLRGLLEGCDVFSSGLFILVAAVSIYWFIFFKLQKEVYTMARASRVGPSYAPPLHAVGVCVCVVVK